MDYNELKPRMDKFPSLSTEEQAETLIGVVEVFNHYETTTIQKAEIIAFASAHKSYFEDLINKKEERDEGWKVDTSKEIIPPLERVMLIYNHCRINELSMNQIHEGFASLLGRSEEFKEGFRLGILELYEDTPNFRYIGQHLGIIERPV